jgi:hypothetical protein
MALNMAKRQSAAIIYTKGGYAEPSSNNKKYRMNGVAKARIKEKIWLKSFSFNNPYNLSFMPSP